MAERTAFERDLERLIVSETERTLGLLDDLARRYGVDAQTVEEAIYRFGGIGLADCWDEFVSDD